MTIDEAIAHAREVANEQKRRSGICVQNNSECDKFSACLKCSKEHEQLAEWLEDYRRLLEFEKSVLANEDGYLALMCERIGYNKAIDDFKKILTIEKIKEYAESDGFINLNNCGLMIFDIAEKLKVGDKND